MADERRGDRDEGHPGTPERWPAGLDALAVLD